MSSLKTAPGQNSGNTTPIITSDPESLPDESSKKELSYSPSFQPIFDEVVRVQNPLIETFEHCGSYVVINDKKYPVLPTVTRKDRFFLSEIPKLDFTTLFNHSEGEAKNVIVPTSTWWDEVSCKLISITEESGRHLLIQRTRGIAERLLIKNLPCSSAFMRGLKSKNPAILSCHYFSSLYYVNELQLNSVDDGVFGVSDIPEGEQKVEKVVRLDLATGKVVQDLHFGPHMQYSLLLSERILGIEPLIREINISYGPEIPSISYPEPDLTIAQKKQALIKGIEDKGDRVIIRGEKTEILLLKLECIFKPDDNYIGLLPPSEAINLQREKYWDSCSQQAIVATDKEAIRIVTRRNRGLKVELRPLDLKWYFEGDSKATSLDSDSGEIKPELFFNFPTKTPESSS